MQILNFELDLQIHEGPNSSSTGYKQSSTALLTVLAILVMNGDFTIYFQPI